MERKSRLPLNFSQPIRRQSCHDLYFHLSLTSSIAANDIASMAASGFRSSTRAICSACLGLLRSSGTNNALHNVLFRVPRIQASSFSTSLILQKRKKGQPKKDMRISEFAPMLSHQKRCAKPDIQTFAALIRYFLSHPKTPRPLRFSRLRYLRHWTIHRAWQLFKAKQRKAQELDLERQYNSMRAACEALRKLGDDGMVGGTNEGRLFRNAMMKVSSTQGVPIEYARSQTEWPSREGWNQNHVALV